jgi:hypothetical protein
MAKKKHRPTSTTAHVKTTNRQPPTVRQTGASSHASSGAEQQKKSLATQKETDSQKPSLTVEEERSNENITTKQVKNPSSSSLGASAAERRRERVASQRVSSTSRSAPSAGEKRRRAVRKSWWERYSLALIGGILLVVVIAVGTFLIIANSPGNGKTGPTDTNILKKVTTVKQSVFADVKTGGIQDVLQPPAGNPPVLTGPHGKPEVFFYGAEFCPYCAAERWSVTVALSRFGTFQQLPLIVSSEDSIPTFTFHGSNYSSDYIDFVPLEAEDGARQPLETPSAAQQQMLKHYNVTGFPFINIADKYIAANAVFDPTVLQGLSQQEIADKLSDPTQDVTQKIVGAANYFTAAICITTNNQPASVCNSDPIPSIRSFMTTNTLAFVSATPPLAVVAENCPGEPAMCRRRGSVVL